MNKPREILTTWVPQSIEEAWMNPRIECDNFKKCHRYLSKFRVRRTGTIDYGHPAEYCCKSCSIQVGGRRKNHDVIPSTNIPWIDALPAHINKNRRSGYSYVQIIGDGKRVKRNHFVFEYTQRKLLPGDQVHHKNHNSLDDRSENLEAIMLSDHCVDTVNWTKQKRI